MLRCGMPFRCGNLGVFGGGLFGKVGGIREHTLGKLLNPAAEKSCSIPLGIVVRRLPGSTRWSAFYWQVSAILPAARSANWLELRRDGDAVEFHAVTLPLTLHRADTEAYLQGLSARVPSVYVVSREAEGDAPLEFVLATASPFEAQDYADTGEEQVDKVPMPDGLIAWVQEFIERHHEEETFVKRRRDKKRIDLLEDGIGDARIRQTTDVYRSPASRREAV